MSIIKPGLTANLRFIVWLQIVPWSWNKNSSGTSNHNSNCSGLIQSKCRNRSLLFSCWETALPCPIWYQWKCKSLTFLPYTCKGKHMIWTWPVVFQSMTTPFNPQTQWCLKDWTFQLDKSMNSQDIAKESEQEVAMCWDDAFFFFAITCELCWLPRMGGRTILVKMPTREFSSQGQGALLGTKTKSSYIIHRDDIW